MRHLANVGLALLLSAAAWLPVAGSTAAADADAPTTCSATLTIHTSSAGTTTQHGQTTHIRDSGVAGSYTSGFLNGFTFTGSQDLVLHRNRAQLHGTYTAVDPGNSANTLTVRYTGHLKNLSSGAATGHFVVTAGTGKFAGFHWSGRIAAQQTSRTPPTFTATDTGHCHPAP